MRPRKRSRTVTCTAPVVTNTDVDLTGKRVTIAGKLAGYWAKGNLAGRIKQLGGELTESFDRTADIVVIASKAKGFRKRIAKMNAVEITEQQLEEIVAERPQPKPAKPPPKADKHSFLDALRRLPREPVVRRDQLVDAICTHAEHGFAIVPNADRGACRPIADVNAPPGTVLAWVSWYGSLYVVPDELPKWLKRDLRIVDDACIHYEVGMDPKTHAAAMRVWVAMGENPESIWKQLWDDEAGYEDISSIDDLTLLETPLADHKVTDMAELNFPIAKLIVVNDDIPW